MKTVSLRNKQNYFFLKKNHKMGIFSAIYGNFRKMQSQNGHFPAFYGNFRKCKYFIVLNEKRITVT